MPEVVIDPHLDYLYNATVRCPYCRAKIYKYTTSCVRCGVHKRQLHEASNTIAKQMKREKSAGKIFLVRRRPHDVTFTSMVLWVLAFGLFGAHSFSVGRIWRGSIQAIATVVSTITVIVVEMEFEHWRDWWRDNVGYEFLPFFLPDVMFVAAITFWVIDVFCVVLNLYAYAVRLGENDEK